MPTLYDLTSEQMALLDMIEGAETQEELDAITTTLYVSKEQFSQKVESYVAVISAIEQREAARTAEYERIKALVDSDKKKASQIKSRLIDAMQQTGTKSLDTKYHKISWRKGVAKVEIDNEALLSGYNETREVVSLNKRRLLNDLKAGKEVLGARLGEGEPSLRIV